MLLAVAYILAAYVAGSIATAVWVGRIVGGLDIREHGSGNAGATNIARVISVPWGLLVGLVDILKGLLPVLLLSRHVAGAFGLANADGGLILGVAAILGHLYPVFAGFKGGKGVLTALGVFIALLPLEAGIAAAVWIPAFAIWRIVSLGSILASLAFFAATIIHRAVTNTTPPISLIVLAGLVAALVLVTHRSNIRRLLAGQESRFKGR